MRCFAGGGLRLTTLGRCPTFPLRVGGTILAGAPVTTSSRSPSRPNDSAANRSVRPGVADLTFLTSQGVDRGLVPSARPNRITVSNDVRTIALPLMTLGLPARVSGWLLDAGLPC